MYMMEKDDKRRWTISGARKRLPKLIASAAREPQALYRRDKLVAAVVSPELKREIEARGLGDRQRPLATALGELRRLCREEGYELTTPKRRDRIDRPSGKRRKP